MAGTLAHLWVFNRVLEKLSGGEMAGKMKKSGKALENQLKEDSSGWRDPYKYDTHIKKGSLLASYGYLGATGPDLFYIPDDALDAMGTIDGEVFADLMHYNKTGGLVISALGKIREERQMSETTHSKAKLENKLAYWMGHMAHIATDVVVHPFVNSMAAAYHKNTKSFENSQGYFGNNIWKMHNKIEHYQDAWVRKYLFEKKAGFEGTTDWAVLDFPGPPPSISTKRKTPFW